jgi:hypothetical protein
MTPKKPVLAGQMTKDNEVTMSYNTSSPLVTFFEDNMPTFLPRLSQYHLRFDSVWICLKLWRLFHVKGNESP